MGLFALNEPRRILLIIGGGIAAYKSLELIRELQRRNISARAILTRAGAQFITALSVASLSGETCYTDLFSLTDETEMGHIELSRSASLIVVAPATADLMAKAAHGLADDLASTALLATDKPVLLAPAMNVRMWEHKATQKNLRTLIDNDALIVGPEEGEMACGEFGFGRMAGPETIADAVEAFFAADASGALAGRRILVTAGPTHEPLDPVRYIANRSSGKQGYAIAGALRDLGADVVLVSGPTQQRAPLGVEIIPVETAREMMAAARAALPVDAAIMCAAVADWRPEIETRAKIKKERGGLTNIPLTENPDILKAIAEMKTGRPRLVVGFAAETGDVLSHARAKRLKKGCDWIIANDVSPGPNCAISGDWNSVTLITPHSEETWAELSKQEVAKRLAQRIARTLAGDSATAEAAE